MIYYMRARRGIMHTGKLGSRFLLLGIALCLKLLTLALNHTTLKYLAQRFVSLRYYVMADNLHCHILPIILNLKNRFNEKENTAPAVCFLFFYKCVPS